MADWDRKSDRVPLHAQIYDALLDEIKSGHLMPGDRTPTESVLVDRFSVSRTTVRRALQDLANAGMLDRQPGRGTFVAVPRFEQRLRRLTGFVEDAIDAGFEAQADVLSIEQVTACRRVAEQLRLSLGVEAMRFERIRLANFQPISFDVTFFSSELGARIAQEDLVVRPFYSILEATYDMLLGHADYMIEASAADNVTARHLDIDVGSPVLRIERTTYLKDDGAPVMFEYLHYRSDRMRYRLRLDRQ